MSWLLTADRCPACTGIHGTPTDWPTCPVHQHLLLLADIGDDGFTYRCPARAPRCQYTHTQTERATMTATQATERAALAVRDSQNEWDSRQLAALTQLGVEDASKADLDVFLHRCQVTGLDPFAGQIAMIKRGGKWGIQTEIDGYRVIAHRAARRDAVELSYGPTYWYDRAQVKHEIWTGDDDPAGASVTVYKNNKPFPATVRFKSFAQKDKSGHLTRQWVTMPDHMIAKCAEAQALRKAFPHDLEGIQIPEEAAMQARAAVVTQAVEQPDTVLAPTGRHVRAVQRGDIQGLRYAIGEQFDALGLDDREERAVYVCKLANTDPGENPSETAAGVSERDLRFALDALAECPDLGALVDLTTPDGNT